MNLSQTFICLDESGWGAWALHYEVQWLKVEGDLGEGECGVGRIPPQWRFNSEGICKKRLVCESNQLLKQFCAKMYTKELQNIAFYTYVINFGRDRF
ncbi:hypothetical protein CDAR_217801 [Caerostris darwini]|uniref:Uncharacterized protein n=1 Tax=Caerostris darwini TaxID=1538125 RepID=A0AAV4MZX7_9ARAC|nr:hypothetical protein CDAR_217801 [Caerostris darwini]